MCMLRELQERLRSLVGGAIKRMAREKANRGRIVELEGQLQALKVQYFPFETTAFVPERSVLTSNSAYSGVLLQSECSDWCPISLSLHRFYCYKECPYTEKLL